MGCACSRRGRGTSIRSANSCQSTQSDWQRRSENCCVFDSGVYQMPEYEMPQQSMQASSCKSGAKQSRKPQRSAGSCSAGAREQQCANCGEERCRCSNTGGCKSSRQQRRRRSCTTIQRSRRTTTYAHLVIPIRACPCTDQSAEDIRSCRSYND